MNALLDTGLTITGQWRWVALIPLAAWYARSVYVRTRPAVPKPTARTLWVLRAVSLAIVLLLLSQPIATYLLRRALRPLVVTLLDTSPSMAVEENGQTRLGAARQALLGALGEHLGEGPSLGFAGRSYPLALDTLSRVVPHGHATDLAGALASATRTIQNRRLLAGVVLISDGRHNLGEDPVATAEQLGIPVFALGLGSEQAPADVQVTSAAVAGPVFAGQAAQVTVALRSWGFADRPVSLRAVEQGTELATEVMQLGADGQVSMASLRLPPLEAGRHMIRVQLPQLGGELSADNNEALVSLEVRQDRARVLLLAGGPGPEVSFLRRTLEMDSTLALTTRVLRDDATFYGAEDAHGSTALDGLDAVVLIEPGVELGGGPWGPSLQSLLRRGGGLLIVAGSRTLAAWADGSAMPDLLPLRASSPGRVVAGGSLAAAPGRAAHPLGRALDADPAVDPVPRADGDDPWRRLPPLLAHLVGPGPAAGATVLLQSEDGAPVVVAGAVGGGRVVAALGAGFWRLDLLASGAGDGPTRMRTLWRDTVRWLCLATPSGRVRVSSDNPVYRAGQAATLSVEVYDELSKPLDGARVEATLEPSGRTTAAEAVGAGRYRTTWPGLAPGEYSCRVEAYLGNTSIGRDEGRFVIEPHTVEADDQRVDPTLLAAIAQASGGAYRPLDRWSELREQLRPPPRLVRGEQHVGVEIQQPAWLAAIVALLTIEWLLRKRNGMLVLALGLLGAATQAPAQLHLSEVLADPPGSESHEEFVELYNGSQVESVDLAGWEIGEREDVDAIVDAGWGTLLAPGQRAVVVDASYFGNSAVFDSVQQWARIVTIDDRSFGRSGWSNTRAQRVVLLRASGDTADSFTFDPALGLPGHSWERTDDPAGNWLISLLPGGTPGRPNSVDQVPAPNGQVTVEASPDPFQDRIEILCRVPEAPALLAITVFDAEGSQVVRLRDWVPAALETRVVWDGLDRRGRTVAFGMYILLAESSAAGRVVHGRRVVVKGH